VEEVPASGFDPLGQMPEGMVDRGRSGNSGGGGMVDADGNLAEDWQRPTQSPNGGKGGGSSMGAKGGRGVKNSVRAQVGRAARLGDTRGGGTSPRRGSGKGSAGVRVGSGRSGVQGNRFEQEANEHRTAAAEVSRRCFIAEYRCFNVVLKLDLAVLALF